MKETTGMTLKVGMDQYCFHRFFGEVYPQQPPPAFNMTLEDYLKFAAELKVDGITLESCFIPRRDDPGYLREAGAFIADHKMDCVWGWGHPDGLEGGRNKREFKDMIKAFEHAKHVGATVMKVVGSSLMFRKEPHGPQIRRLAHMFTEAVKVAEDHGIKMAVENHIDFTHEEILELIERVSSPYLGLNFDTGNFLRLLSDPIKGAEKLAPYTLATHVKDLKVQKGVSPEEWFFFSCTPVGDGYVDNRKLAQLLKDADFQGFLAVEIDFLHPDYHNDEHAAVRQSVAELRRIVESLD
jgi:sugar phosphate isomerase/epimerase